MSNGTGISKTAFVIAFASLAVALAERDALDLARLNEIMREHIIELDKAPPGHEAALDLYAILNLLGLARPDDPPPMRQ